MQYHILMKSYIAAIAVIVILVIAGFFTWSFFTTKPSSSLSVSQNTFPNSSSTPLTSTTGNGSSMSITLNDGSSVQTRDFLNNGITIEDPANKATYYLAGSSGACSSNGTCPIAGSSTDYTIVYYPIDGSFGVGLATEPLGAVRKEAEQYLMNTLGLSEQQMCSLKYTVMTTTYVSQQFGGENLGFSFCPNAVVLP